MDMKQQLELEKIKQHQKSTGVAFFLWLFTGALGGHRFYTKRYKTGLLFLIAFITGWVCITAWFAGAATDALTNMQQAMNNQPVQQLNTGVTAGVIAFIIIAIMSVIVLIDAFSLSRWVRQHNLKVLEQYERDKNV